MVPDLSPQKASSNFCLAVDASDFSVVTVMQQSASRIREPIRISSYSETECNAFDLELLASHTTISQFCLAVEGHCSILFIKIQITEVLKAYKIGTLHSKRGQTPRLYFSVHGAIMSHRKRVKLRCSSNVTSKTQHIYVAGPENPFRHCRSSKW